jgi:hypothetical protein
MQEYSEQEMQERKRTFQQFVNELKAVHYKELKDLSFERIVGITVWSKQMSLNIDHRIPKNIKAAIHQKWEELFPGSHAH